MLARSCAALIVAVLTLGLSVRAPARADDEAHSLPAAEAPKVGDQRAVVRRFTTAMTMTIRSPGREPDTHESTSIARSRVLATVRGLAGDGSVEGLDLKVLSRRRLSPTVGGETDPLQGRSLLISKSALKTIDGAEPSLDAEDAWKLDRGATPYLVPDIVSTMRGKALPASGLFALNPKAIKAHLELRSSSIRFKTCEARITGHTKGELIAAVTISAIDQRENAPRLELKAAGELRLDRRQGRLVHLDLKGTLGLSEDRMGRSIRGEGKLQLMVRCGPPELLKTAPAPATPQPAAPRSGDGTKAAPKKDTERTDTEPSDTERSDKEPNEKARGDDSEAPRKGSGT